MKKACLFLLLLCHFFKFGIVCWQNLRCAIEGGKALKLVLTGSCIPQTPLKEVKTRTLHLCRFKITC